MPINLKGWLLSDSGLPVASKLAEAFVSGTTTPAATTSTDANGMWAFSSLAQATYDVVLTAAHQKRKLLGGRQEQFSALTVDDLQVLTSLTLPVQTANTVLAGPATAPAAAPAFRALVVADLPAHNLLSATHGDTTAGAAARGDIITAQGASPKWAKLGVGGANAFLRSDGTDVLWSTGFLNITAAKTLTVQKSLVMDGTDGKGITLTGGLTVGADTAITGGGTLALGGYTATVPATGTVALRADTMYIGTTAHALNRATAAEGLSGITGLTPGADFTLTQNAVAAMTSVEAGAVANTLYLKAGNVGIGTTSPGAKLDVLAGLDGYAYIGGVSNGRAVKLGTDANGYAVVQGILRTDGSAKDITLQNSGGNVGIGTTSPAANGIGGSPTILQVAAASSNVAGLSLSNADNSINAVPGALDFVSTGLSNADKRLAEIAAIKGDASTANPLGILTFSTANGGTVTEKMRISAAGGVYIGSSPSDPGAQNLSANILIGRTSVRIPAAANGSPATGDMYVDAAAGRLYVYHSAGWHYASLT